MDELKGKSVTDMTTEELDAIIASGSDDVVPTPPSEGLVEAPAPSRPAEPPPADKPPEPPAEPSELDRLKKQLADAQSMIGRQSAEIGEARKRLQELMPKPEPVTPDQVLTDPVGATKKIVEETMAERQRREQEQVEMVQKERIARANFIAKAVPDILNLLPDMVSEALADGVPVENAERFKSDVLSEDPIITIMLARRARMAKELKQLREENEQLKGQPKRVLDEVNRAAKQRPAVSAAHGRTDPQGGESRFDRAAIARMSDKELLELMKGG